MKLSRKNSQHRERVVVQGDRSTDHRGIAGEAALPQRVRNQSDAALQERLILVAPEGAAHRRLDPEHVEEVRGDSAGRKPLRPLARPEDETVERIARDPVQTQNLPIDVLEVRIRNLAALLAWFGLPETSRWASR